MIEIAKPTTEQSVMKICALILDMQTEQTSNTGVLKDIQTSVQSLCRKQAEMEQRADEREAALLERLAMLECSTGKCIQMLNRQEHQQQQWQQMNNGRPISATNHNYAGMSTFEHLLPGSSPTMPE